MNASPNTPSELLNAFRTRHPTSPRLSWYGPDSERVEFSGRVLENWVAKTANYLVDELDAEPGTTVALDLPLHWRSMVWLLATWAVGATAVTGDRAAGTVPDAAGTVDVLATVDPAAVHERLPAAGPAPLVVAVALPALQMRWMGDLPPRTLDYSGDVRSHADVFFAEDTPEPSAIAWQHNATATSYAGLFARDSGDRQPEAPRRQLLQARDGWDAVVRSALMIWAGGGSVVLLDAGIEATDHLCSTENITHG
ncbi:TIGR03089 family protein [Arthrobacter sp. LAPM80]|uniref:TIGR03089 family protein n=1 Tax=Arthrobacter sp. LAPM80 TaxID=3141788 RepID=UPI00398B8D7A